MVQPTIPADVLRRQRFFARHLFELRVRQAKGEAYQGLFNKVMQLKHPSFVPMRPYGNLGDRKNDGYIRDSGTFFQVYAPQAPSANLAEAAGKAAKDFAGLRAFWSKTHTIRTYRFAFNDEYGGSVVPIEKALAVISKKHSIQASAFLAKDLETEAFSLPFDELERAIDIPIPDPTEITDANFIAVRDVIHHIMNTDAPNPPTGKLLAPDFSQKIQFNKLSGEVADLLRVSARQSEVIDNFFSNRAGTHRQDLRDHLADIYSRARANANVTGASSDVIFFEIWETMQPPSRRRDRNIQNAALIVMAYYFEACDIFEAPHASP